MREFAAYAVIALALAQPALVTAEPTYYADRAAFLAAVGSSITDTYAGYTSDPQTPAQLTNEQINEVLGETRYQPITHPQRNSVGDVYVFGDGTNYCSGCNGNFRLVFDRTSLSFGGGIFGVGVDIVLHTSRGASIGDDVPGDRVVDGVVAIKFTDGALTQVTIPADVGFFGPQVYFLGITDARGIESITIGVDAREHFWVIDNLTVGARPGPIEVAIDIKPGSDPNPINPRSKGVIPVAILSTEDFDATTIDPLSVEFGPNGATEAHNRGHIEDVNGDGFDDMVLHFRTQETGIQCGDIEASLTGQTFDGTSIEGFDSIQTVGCE